MWTCPTCSEAIDDDFDACWQCGTDRQGGSVESTLDFDAMRSEAGAPEPVPDVTLTTAPSLEGYRVVETIDIVTAECVVGVNAFRDLMAGWTDLLGGRSGSSQKVLRSAKDICLSELRREAHALGANAVIAVDLDYSEMSGGGKSMLFLVASGTAVSVESVAGDR